VNERRLGPLPAPEPGEMAARLQEIVQKAAADETQGTDTVLIMLTVPRHWRKMGVPEIERALRYNQPHLIPTLAHEVKRWQGSGVLDLTKLRELLEERGALDG
jgi:hypothetical protein